MKSEVHTRSCIIIGLDAYQIRRVDADLFKIIITYHHPLHAQKTKKERKSPVIPARFINDLCIVISEGCFRVQAI